MESELNAQLERLEAALTALGETHARLTENLDSALASATTLMEEFDTALQTPTDE